MVVEGEEIVKGRSGREEEKRTMRLREGDCGDAPIVMRSSMTAEDRDHTLRRWLEGDSLCIYEVHVCCSSGRWSRYGIR